MEKLLPVGSIIKLKNNKEFMIIGYSPNKPVVEDKYDYICCLPKVGITRKKSEIKLNIDYFYINNKDINQVLYIGYSDEMFDLYEYSLFICKGNIDIIKSKYKTISEREIKEFFNNCLNDIKELGDRSE